MRLNESVQPPCHHRIRQEIKKARHETNKTACGLIWDSMAHCDEFAQCSDRDALGVLFQIPGE